MSIEQKRNQEISGYVHPTTSSTGKSKVYKTFTEGKKAKKNEKFGSVNAGNNYATLEVSEAEEVCPKCKEPVVDTCPCGHSDKKCSNGHVWYTDREGKMKLGNPHSKK